MIVNRLLLVSTVLIVGIHAKLPNFIKKCSRSDPELNNCVYESACMAMPFIFKGVEELYLPSLENYRIGPMHYTATKNIDFFTKDGVGIQKNMTFQKVKMNPNDGTFKFDLHIDYSQWLIDFVANGTILGKPINENGYANVTIRNLLFHFEGELGTANVNGVKYLKLTNGIDSQVYIKHFEYVPEREENTKNPMSDEQEEIFNRNLAKIHPSMEKALTKLGSHIAHLVVNTFLLLAPENELFLL